MSKSCFARILEWTSRIRRTAILIPAAIAGAGVADAQVCTTAVVSNPPSGGWGDGNSSTAVLNSSGNIIAFSSTSTNLVVPDLNSQRDAFWLDRRSAVLVRVSESSAGVQANNLTTPLALSEDGRFVLMASDATNLVPGDTNGRTDAFVHDVLTHTTERVSVSSTGAEAADSAGRMAMSGDGRFVVFDNYSSNLVPGDNNASADIFLRDRIAGTTTRISVNASGVEGNLSSLYPSISSDGRWIAYTTYSTNIIVPDSVPNKADVVVYDRLTGQSRRASQTQTGVQANADCVYSSISADGRFVAFETSAFNLFPGSVAGDKICVWDAANGALRPVSVTPSGVFANGGNRFPSISGDGRFIAFESTSTNLVPGSNGGWNALVHDMLTGANFRASENDAGQAANGQTLRPRISADGKHVVFFSRATNLVPGTPSAIDRTYVRDCIPTAPTAYCVGKTNSRGCLPLITSAGSPSASAGSGFDIQASELISARPGVLLYSTTGSAQLPFQAGLLCVAPPYRFIGAQSTRGNATPCSGSMSVDFNAWIASGGDLSLVVGQGVFAQFVHRDPGLPLPYRASLTNGLMFVVGP